MAFMRALLKRSAQVYYRRRLARLGDEPTWREIGKGLQMEIDPRDSMDRAFFLGNYDRWLLRSIEMVVRAGDVCVDVGAHKGYCTMMMAHASGPMGSVFAFEPDPRARESLESNCRRNALTNVSVFPYALGHESGSRTLCLSSQLGWSTFFPNRESRPTIQGELTVPLRSFDGLLETAEIQLKPKALRFIKIDAEGAEPLVITGMRRTLMTSSPLLWIEINVGSLAEAGSTASEVRRLLMELGLSIYSPGRSMRMGVFPKLKLRPISETRFEPSEIADIVALRPKDPLLIQLARDGELES